ncbi:MAG TPA: HD domain-containing protein [Flavipsychrobacter sp.]
MDKVLEAIRDFADHAHGEQRRKYTPDQYIVHPVRVMELCSQYTDNTAVLAAALLHDVLEDTRVTGDELKEFLLQKMDKDVALETLGLVVELTDVYIKKDFPRMNRRSRKEKESGRIVQASPDAQTIKYADIIDNSKEIAQHDPDFAKVFLSECRSLLRKMDKGNAELHARAVTAVDKGLEQLKH